VVHAAGPLPSLSAFIAPEVWRGVSPPPSAGLSCINSRAHAPSPAATSNSRTRSSGTSPPPAPALRRSGRPLRQALLHTRGSRYSLDLNTPRFLDSRRKARGLAACGAGGLRSPRRTVLHRLPTGSSRQHCDPVIIAGRRAGPGNCGPPHRPPCRAASFPPRVELAGAGLPRSSAPERISSFRSGMGRARTPRVRSTATWSA